MGSAPKQIGAQVGDEQCQRCRASPQLRLTFARRLADRVSVLLDEGADVSGPHIKQDHGLEAHRGGELIERDGVAHRQVAGKIEMQVV